MARVIISQSAVSKPVRIAVAGLAVDWLTILEANDFSLPDPQGIFPDDVDPADADRRIEPGVALIESPLMFHNVSDANCWVELQVLTEGGDSVVQCKITIPPGDTYTHPAPGQRLLKLLKASANGDRMQVRAQTVNVIHLTAAASEGGSEQHQPTGA